MTRHNITQRIPAYATITGTDVVPEVDLKQANDDLWSDNKVDTNGVKKNAKIAADFVNQRLKLTGTRADWIYYNATGVMDYAFDDFFGEAQDGTNEIIEFIVPTIAQLVGGAQNIVNFNTGYGSRVIGVQYILPNVQLFIEINGVKYVLTNVTQGTTVRLAMSTLFNTVNSMIDTIDIIWSVNGSAWTLIDDISINLLDTVVSNVFQVPGFDGTLLGFVFWNFATNDYQLLPTVDSWVERVSNQITETDIFKTEKPIGI